MPVGWHFPPLFSLSGLSSCTSSSISPPELALTECDWLFPQPIDDQITDQQKTLSATLPHWKGEVRRDYSFYVWHYGPSNITRNLICNQRSRPLLSKMKVVIQILPLTIYYTIHIKYDGLTNVVLRYCSCFKNLNMLPPIGFFKELRFFSYNVYFASNRMKSVGDF